MHEHFVDFRWTVALPHFGVPALGRSQRGNQHGKHREINNGKTKNSAER